MKMPLKRNSSKNRKKGWRTNVDVADVEEFIDDQQFQHRVGGLVSEKADEELFFVERSESSDIREPVESNKETEDGNLKCYRPLVNNSHIQVPCKLNKTRHVDEKLSENAKITKRKRLQRLLLRKSKSKPVRKSRDDKESVVGTYDLWTEEKEASGNIDKDVVKHYKQSVKSEPVKTPCHLYQPASLLPAIEVPHPGSSYNPAYDKHQELLHIAHDDEVKKLKVAQKFKRAMTDKFPKAKDAPSQETWLQEMSQGFYPEEDNDVDTDDNGDEFVVKNPPVRRDQKKLRSKRKREQELKTKKLHVQKKKMEAKRENEIYSLRKIKKDVMDKERITKRKQRSRIEKEAEKLHQPNRLGKNKYQPADVDVSLSEELSGSLRNLKPEGQLLEDRYKSFQRRNILQTTVKQKIKRKYKLKRYTKRSHREV